MSKELALQQINGLENSLGQAVRRVYEALRDDGRIDFGEGIDIGTSGLMIGLQVASLLRSLSVQGASDLLYVLENSDRVLRDDNTNPFSFGGNKPTT